MFINKIFDYISKKGHYNIQTPWVGAIGNCAEEIYYGLLKARRENKKVIFLFPYDLPWKFRFSKRWLNRELLKVESDYRYLPNNKVWIVLGECVLTVIYAFFRITAIFMRKCFNKSLSESYLTPDIGVTILWCPKDVDYFSWEIVKSYKWEDQLNEYLPVKINMESYWSAEQLRIKMGIPKEHWFVCLHVREGGFCNDYKESACRNASIRNYVKGIQAITDAGGWVVRMGDKTMTPLPTMERVIDYPHTQFKSDLMDIYLIYGCRFYIGSQSGIWDVAALFQKPILIPNMSAWTFVYPPRRGDLGIIKHIYSLSKKRFLSLQEILEEPFECQYFSYLGDDYIMYENTPEEIYDLIVEYLEYLEKPEESQYSQLQIEFNRRRIVQGHKILENQVIGKNHSSAVFQKYRIASRVDSYLGALGQKYLEQNWKRSITNNKG